MHHRLIQRKASRFRLAHPVQARSIILHCAIIGFTLAPRDV
jgi:hypothetical protein